MDTRRVRRPSAALARWARGGDWSIGVVKPHRTVLYWRLCPSPSSSTSIRALHAPPSRLSGPDPYKLRQQIARFGAGTSGMPPPWVYRGSDGALMIYNGVTRATRIARLAPGTRITVEVVRQAKVPLGHLPKIGDLIP
jgi:hypothetical protein